MSDDIQNSIESVDILSDQDEYDEDITYVDVTKQLIELVHLHPILWDHNLEDFRNKNKRDLTWNIIAKNLGCSYDDCVTKWKYIRDKYTRDRRKKAAGGSTDVREWSLLPMLKFLEPVCIPRRNKGSISLLRPVAPTSAISSYTQGSEGTAQSVSPVSITPTILKQSSQASSPTTEEGSTLNNNKKKSIFLILEQNPKRQKINDTTMVVKDVEKDTKPVNNKSNNVAISAPQCTTQNNSSKVFVLASFLQRQYDNLTEDLQEEFDMEVISLMRNYSLKMKSKVFLEV